MGSIALPALGVKSPQPESPLDQYARMLQIQQMGQQGQIQQQQLKAAQLSNQEGEMNLKSRQALTDAYTKAGGDLSKALPIAAQNGADPQSLIKLQEAAKKQQMDNIALLNAKGARAIQEADLMQGVHDQISKLPPEQRSAAYPQGIQALANAGIDTSKMPQDYPGDQAFEMGGIALKGHKQQLEDLAKQSDVAKTNQQAANEAAQLPGLQADSRKKAMEADAMQQFGGLSPEMMKSKYIAIQQKAPAMRSPADKAFSAAYEKEKAITPTATVNLQAGLLNDQAKQMAADMYAKTGQLPSGMRSPGMSAGILNTAAQQPGVNIAANKATYQADAGSLHSMQKQMDQVTAFENTAGKNLDNFLTQAKKVVDFGGPLVNKPLREAARLAGSQNQAAFDAARTTALTEIAKVLSSANAGSGVLSDSARHEVEGLIGRDASLGQIYRAASVLKQDMANRHEAYQNQLTEIRGRIGAGNKTTAPAPQSHPFFNQLGGAANPK